MGFGDSAVRCKLYAVKLRAQNSDVSSFSAKMHHLEPNSEP